MMNELLSEKVTEQVKIFVTIVDILWRGLRMPRNFSDATKSAETDDK